MIPFNIGAWQIVLIVVLVIILIAVGRLPKVASALGKTVKSFQTGKASSRKDKPDDSDNQWDNQKPRKPKRLN